MRVKKIEGETAVAESGGLKRSANLSLLKGVKIGDYILVHAGFAIEKVTLKLLKAMT
jgi:hydrogenase expression/formation protein HypC